MSLRWNTDMRKEHRWSVQSVAEPGTREDDGDWIDTTVIATDAEEAAETAVSEYFWADPSDGDIPDMIVKVRLKFSDDEADWQRFRVIGEATVDFYVRGV